MKAISVYALALLALPCRLFVNAENLTNFRHTHDARLVLPTRGSGGRWTSDAWAPLEGFVVNAGVKLAP